MAIRYEYESDCCKHGYIEMRKADHAQVITVCNNCGQGQYVLTSQTEFEDIVEPEQSISTESNE